jgi:prepilin-type N-terminal cleavage/methylation domain-containing protein
VRELARTRRGVTLLETLVALAVISLIAASALATAAAQTRLTTRARRTERAEWLATERLAMLRVLPATALRSLPDSIAVGRYAPPNDGFAWRVTSTPVLGELDLYEIGVEVGWEDGALALQTRRYVPLDAPPEAR